MTFAHVSHAKHEAKLTVALTNHCVLRELQGLRPEFGTCHFCKNNSNLNNTKIDTKTCESKYLNSYHKSLNNHSRYTLQAHYKHSLRTFFCCRPDTVPYSMLSFNRKQKTRSKSMYVQHARHPIRFCLVTGQMIWF